VVKLEILEKYELLGEMRYRIRIKNTKIILNVVATSDNEALKKAKELINEIKLHEVIDQYKVEA